MRKDKKIGMGMNHSKFNEIVKHLNEIPQFMTLTGVERAEELLKELGNPEKDLKIIHVAGTNGKGSVCAYLNQVLYENGYHTGLFTSPHLVDIRERIRIDSEMISEEQFVMLFERVEAAAEKLEKQGISLAYFDYLFGIAMCYFKEQKTDYVIMETGLGGRLDATNAVKNPVLSVITTISLEHTAILGDTIAKIATEKAGIIKEKVPVVYLDKEVEVTKVITRIAKEQGATAVPLHFQSYEILKNNGKYIDFSLHNEYYKNDCFKVATPAVYQAQNCALALMALCVLEQNTGAHLDQEVTHKAVWNTHWDGRMEEVMPSVYIDGAHNPEGIESFIRSAKTICQNKKCTLLFSVVKDKNFDTMIKQLCECNLFHHIIVTQVGGMRKLDKESMEDAFKRYTSVPVEELEDTRKAFLTAVQQKSDVLMCAGSLYLVGEVKRICNDNDIN